MGIGIPLGPFFHVKPFGHHDRFGVTVGGFGIVGGGVTTGGFWPWGNCHVG